MTTPKRIEPRTTRGFFVGHNPWDKGSYPREIGNAPSSQGLARARARLAEIIHVKSVTRTREIGNAST